MNYRNIPLLRVVCPFIIGIIITDLYSINLNELIVLILIFLFSMSILLVEKKIKYFQKTILFGIIIQILFIGFGIIFTTTKNEQNQNNHFSIVSAISDTVVVRGIICDDPGKKLKIKLKLSEISNDTNKITPCSGNLLVFINDYSSTLDLKYGYEILIKTKIQEPQNQLNPKSFNYKKYLHYQNIHYIGYGKKEDIQIVARDKGNMIWELAYKLKNHFLNSLNKYFKTTDEYAVATALLLGYKEDLSDELKNAYSDTGSMHALAVSGTHVGLLYSGMLIILSYFPLRGKKGRFIETLISLITIWVFTFVTGASASVLRASVMFSTYLLGKMMFRQVNNWNIISGSAFLLLVYNPLFLFDAGFQLSYAAVAGLAYYYPLFYRASPIIKSKSIDAGYKVLLVGIAAQLGTLPLSLYYFHQFPTYFWLSGWVVVSGGALFLWAGSLLLIIDFILPDLAIYLGNALYYLTWGMNQLIRWIQDLPGSVISGIWLEHLAVGLLSLCIVSLGIMYSTKSKKWMLFSLLMVVLLTAKQINQYFEQMYTNKICIYAIRGKTMIDLFCSKNRIGIGEHLEPKQEDFACKNHRWASGTNHDTGNYTTWKKDTVNLNMGVVSPIIFSGKIHVAIIDSSTTLPKNKQLVDAILLLKNPAIDLEQLIIFYPTNIIIADGSNRRKKIIEWREKCKKLNLRFHYTQEQGAWIKQEINWYPNPG